MSIVKVTMLAICVFSSAPLAWAAESDELRAQAHAIQREAAELAEQGHQQEAEQLERRALAMLEEAERLEPQRAEQARREMAELHQRLEGLRHEEAELAGNPANQERLEDIRREAERIELELHERMPRPMHGMHRHADPGHVEPGHEGLEQRLAHMRQAVEHLNQAGLHDVAEQVARRAEATERELHEAHRQAEMREPPHRDAMHEVMRQLDELRHELGQLREHVQELSHR